MRRNKRDTGGSLDALLDTVANVVGILVVVLAVTQLLVGEAVRRIHTDESTGEAQKLRPAGVAATHELSRLEDALRTRATPAEEAAVSTERFDTLVADARARAGDRKRSRSEVVAALLHTSQQAAAEEAKLDALRAARARLEIRMRKVLPAQSNAAHALRLPDPRPAPIATRERTFFVRYGRVALIDFEDLYARLNRGLRAVAGDPASGQFAASLLVGHFQREVVGTERFRWHLSDRAGIGIAARLAFRTRDFGETRETLLEATSTYQKALDTADPAEHFLHFHVWSDSFASYLTARAIAEARGYSVGWRAYDREAEHEGILQPNVPREPTPVD